MQDIQCIHELSDQDLETVSGGAGHFSLASAHASANAGASATGGFFHINEAFASTESITVINNRGMAASFAFGFAFAVAL